MKSLLIVLITAFNSFAALGQDKDLTDSTEYRFGLPVSNDDTTATVPADKDPRNLWTRVSPRELPEALRKTLSSDSLYAGWQKSDLFFDQHINQYIIRIRDGKSMRTYGFTRHGRPTTFSEEDID